MASKHRKPNTAFIQPADGALIIAGQIDPLLSRLKEVYGPEAVIIALWALLQTWISTMKPHGFYGASIVSLLNNSKQAKPKRSLRK